MCTELVFFSVLFTYFNVSTRREERGGGGKLLKSLGDGRRLMWYFIVFLFVFSSYQFGVDNGLLALDELSNHMAR